MIEARSGPGSRELRAALEAILSPAPPRPGFIHPPRESLRRPPLDRDFVEQCRRAVNALVPRIDRGGTIGVASAGRREGRSTVAAGIAIALARDTELPVLLLDLDLDSPGQAGLFGVGRGPGLADFLEGRESLRALSGEPERRLWLVPAGSHATEVARLYRMFAGAGHLDALKALFPWIVVDLPPALENPHVSLITELLDWVLIVARYHSTTLRALQQAADLIGVEGARSGFMLTDNASRIPSWIKRLL